MDQQDAATARVSRLLDSEPVVWLSTVRPDGLPHLVPIWFSWDGETVLIASKPHAKKVANLRANPRVMLALGEPEEDFDVGLLEGVAEILDEPSAASPPRVAPAEVSRPAGRDRPRPRGVPRDLLARHPDPPDALLPVARADDARRAPIRAGPAPIAGSRRPSAASPVRRGLGRRGRRRVAARPRSRRAPLRGSAAPPR